MFAKNISYMWHKVMPTFYHFTHKPNIFWLILFLSKVRACLKVSRLFCNILARLAASGQRLCFCSFYLTLYAIVSSKATAAATTTSYFILQINNILFYDCLFFACSTFRLSRNLKHSSTNRTERTYTHAAAYNCISSAFAVFNARVDFFAYSQ